MIHLQKLSYVVIVLFSFVFISNAQEKKTEKITSSIILQKADEACKNLKSIEYKVVFDQPSQHVTAHVFQEKDDVKDVGLGESKFLVNGTIFSEIKNTDFKFSYDGSYFKFSEGKKEVFLVKDPDVMAVSRTLGLDYYMTVFRQFGSNEGMKLIIDRAVGSEYLGIKKMNSKDAYHISVIQSTKNPMTGQQNESVSEWYFDVDTFLPVGFVTNNGQTFKTIDIIKINEVENIDFEINNDLDLTERAITGREPNIEGLPAVGEVFPDFYLEDFKGNEFNNEVFKRNKITIVDFWGTWCMPCIRAMPELEELYVTYKNKGLNVIGISVNDKPNRPKKFVESKGFTYQFFENGDGLAKELKLNTFPTLFFIDSDGKIIYAEKGVREDSSKDFETIINKIIAK